MTRPVADDAVVRMREFEQAHREVTFTVDREVMSHRAAWTDQETGEHCSIRSLSLTHLLDVLEEEFS